MVYSSDLQTKEDCQILLQEIKAYRELESQEINFNGIVLKNTNEYSLGSEDAYYEMDIQSLEEALEHWDYNNKPKKHNKKPKTRLNKYSRKQITKDKLLKLHKYGKWWTTHKQTNDEDKFYIIRCYIGNHKNSRTTYHKKKANKKVRKYKGMLKRNNYRKLYDYWWEIF